MNKIGCIDCGKPWSFTPSLKQRGMTWIEAKSIFIDSKGGRCTSCFINHRSAESLKLIQKNILTFH